MVKSVYGQRLAAELGKPSRFQLRDAPGLGHRTAPREFQTAEDIIPIAELKSNMSEIVRGLDQRPRPLVVTLNGKPAAVVMSPREYDALSYRARFVDAVNEGLADTAAGRVHDAEQVFSELESELSGKKRPRAR